MEITPIEKELAYSILPNVNTSTNKERELELRGILKGILIKKYNDNNAIRNIKFDFSNGKIEIIK